MSLYTGNSSESSGMTRDAKVKNTIFIIRFDISATGRRSFFYFILVNDLPDFSSPVRHVFHPFQIDNPSYTLPSIN